MWWRCRTLRTLLALAVWIGSVTTAVGQTSQPSAQTALTEALAVLQQGEIARARQLLESIVERWPGYREARYHLGRLAFDRGDLAVAAEYLDTASQGRFPRVFSARYYLGKTRILQRDYSAAIAALDAALETAPEFGPALMERGRARLFQSEIEAGLEDLLASLDGAEPPGAAAILAAQVLIDLERYEEAGRIAMALRDRSSAGDRWYRRSEWLLSIIDRGTNTWSLLASAMDQDAAAGDLYWAFGEYYRRLEPTRARSLFRLTLDHDSENPVAWHSLRSLTPPGQTAQLPASMPNLQSALIRAERQWQQGNLQEAGQIAARLLALRPGLVPAHQLAARLAERDGDLWRAAWIHERLLDWLGPIPGFGRRLAAVAQAMGAEDLALCGVEMATVGYPKDGELDYLRGAIAADRGATELAIRSLERAQEKGLSDVRLWLRLGELHFEQMDITASIAAYEQAMAADPAAAEAVRSFALSSLTTEQYVALRDLLETHIEQHPGNVNTLYSLGVMSLRDNRLGEAEAYFRRLVEIAPDHRQVHYNLGQVLLRQGQAEAGQQEMARFREIKAAEDREWERHNQAHFRRVEARERVDAGEPDAAIPLYLESVTDGTAELSDFLELAAANLAAGDSVEAVKGYEGVLRSYPYHRDALEGLAAAAAAAGASEALAEAQGKLEILDWPCPMTTPGQSKG